MNARLKKENEVEVSVDQKLSDAISLELNSTIYITPPASRTFDPPRLRFLHLETGLVPLMEQGVDVNMQLVRSRGERHRAEPSQQMVSNALPRATRFGDQQLLVLSAMEVGLEKIEVVANPAHGNHPDHPDESANAKEGGRFKGGGHFYLARRATGEK